MSDLSELIRIGKNIEAQNEEIIRLLKKISGEEEKTLNIVENQLKPFPENPFDFSTLGYDDLDDEEEEIVDVFEVETPHFEDSLDIGEVYFMEDFNPFKITIKNNELIIDNFDGSHEASDYYLAELVAN